MPGKIFSAYCVAFFILFIAMGVAADSVGYADEEEKRRVDISLTIFPRIVAVDNNFRTKLNSKNKVILVFLYVGEKDRALSLASSIKIKNKNIGGMYVEANALSLKELLNKTKKNNITAIFLSERLSEDDLKKVMAYAGERSRIVFSPFTGDVERGVTVGISVTNRVKPYFNLLTLRNTGVVINALLMKMSKRYE